MANLSPIGPVDLAAERAELGPALEEAALRVLRSGQYVLGPEVQALEQAFAELCGVRHAWGVASGTDALYWGLRALGVGPGCTVVTSAYTFFASAGAPALLGARVWLADVDPRTGLVTRDTLEAALDSAPGEVRCALPVHLYGQLCDMRALKELCDPRGIALLEDGAQAHGARRDGYACGQLGAAGTFSFYPTKNLGAAGEGGIVVTRDGETACRLMQMRDHGSSAKYVHTSIGTNSRLAAMQAAVLRVKLPHLATWNERRRANAARYNAAFASTDAVQPLRCVDGAEHVYHQYVVRVRSTDGTSAARDGVLAKLGERGIHAAVHYPTPVHLQEAARDWGYGPGDFPAAEALAREVLCLPVHPFLAEADVDRVAESVVELAASLS